jgi:hypothetical protein
MWRIRDPLISRSQSRSVAGELKILLTSRLVGIRIVRFEQDFIGLK